MQEPEVQPEDNIVNKAEQTLSDLGNTAANQAADLAQQSEEQIHHAGEQAKAAAKTLVDQGEQKLSDAAQQTSDQIDSAAHKASGILHDVASSLRRHAPEQGATGDMTRQVAEGLEQGSSFLEEQSRKGVVAQAGEWVLSMLVLLSLAVAAVAFLAWLGNRRE
jgi:hypothetical protein